MRIASEEKAKRVRKVRSEERMNHICPKVEHVTGVCNCNTWELG